MLGRQNSKENSKLLPCRLCLGKLFFEPHKIQKKIASLILYTIPSILSISYKIQKKIASLPHLGHLPPYMEITSTKFKRKQQVNEYFSSSPRYFLTICTQNSKENSKNVGKVEVHEEYYKLFTDKIQKKIASQTRVLPVPYYARDRVQNSKENSKTEKGRCMLECIKLKSYKIQKKIASFRYSMISSSSSSTTKFKRKQQVFSLQHSPFIPVYFPNKIQKKIASF